MPKPRKSAFEPGYVAIIERLIARRREIGMSQVELGALYGEDQPFISRVERFQRRIDVWEFAQFCQILKITPAAILDPVMRDEAKRRAEGNGKA